MIVNDRRQQGPQDTDPRAYGFKDVVLNPPPRRLRGATIKRATVNLHRLNATQGSMDPAKVENMRTAEFGKVEPPSVYKVGKELYVFDGHHRIAGEMAKGKTRGRVNLVDQTVSK